MGEAAIHLKSRPMFALVAEIAASSEEPLKGAKENNNT